MASTDKNALPASLTTGLKEWDALCRLMGEGRQVFLLRKGGIVEKDDVFAMRSPAFVLLPTHEHQSDLDFKPVFQPRVQAGPGPAGPFPSTYAALSNDVRRITSDQARALLPLSVWSDAYLEKKIAYRPDQPLHLVVLRVFISAAPGVIPADPSYAGCMSWVALNAPVSSADFSPVLSDGDFAARRQELLKAIS